MTKGIVFVVGSGGREHAICWKLSQSSQVDKIYVSPGNRGIFNVPKVFSANVNVENNQEVVEWAVERGIELAIIGPEVYLANGLGNDFRKQGIKCFGPDKEGAKLETDKVWAKTFMSRHNIPTAKWKSFTDPNLAKDFIHKAPFEALVVKASGLAAGKGVIVGKNKQEACQAVDDILMKKTLGSAGDEIVIEELLVGEEVSVLAFTDGKTVVPLLPAQDHKRIFNEDLGPNTGGMGAYCPCPLIEQHHYEIVNNQVFQRTIQGFRKDNISFVGVLYAGLILTGDEVKVLEFNCRFGDPETQVLLPLMRSDLFPILKACCEGNLDAASTIEWHEDCFAVGVVLASRGYPKSSSKGQPITGLEVERNNLIFHSGTDLSPEGNLITNGGRVLIVVNTARTLITAATRATEAARTIQFDGKQYRTDIARKGIPRSILRRGGLTYKSSGVDIQAGDNFISNIKPGISLTNRSGVMGTIGGFGGLFDPKGAGYVDPILVSGTDGVGTKLKIAIEYGKHDTVGIDLVAMCVNDVLAHGAEPLFFLDYFSTGQLDVDVATQVIQGITEGCRRANCALIGGETAEMPSMYSPGDYDLAGFTVGAVERSNLLPRIEEIEPGDVVIGLPSTGIHSNGFSLVRKVLKMTNTKLTDLAPFDRTRTMAQLLLEPTKIYTNLIPAIRNSWIKAFAHITGGGLVENIPRILPDNLSVVLDSSKWDIPPIFKWLAVAGGISEAEILKTLNCGIGGVVIASPKYQNDILDQLKDDGPLIIGHVEEKLDRRVIVKHMERSMEHEMRVHLPKLMSVSKKRVGVLISGCGTNLQALINATLDPSENIGAEIVLVISNKANVEGLGRAERAGIKTLVVEHTKYPSREAFDSILSKELELAGVEIVCLAGFMRILSKDFVERWNGSLINIHPSLLPSFKGANAHKDVLAARVRLTGCTVHFVHVEIDSGAIIEQEAVPVLPNDTIETLKERVKTAEHRAYPRALKNLATGQVKLNENGTIAWTCL